MPESTVIAEVFPLDSGKVYYSMDFLTLDTDEGTRTLRMGAWLNVDPVRIHKMIVREKVLQVDSFEVLTPLLSKLRHADPDYFKRFMGLKVTIDFPGYASSWWRKLKHEDKVYLSKINQFKLFQKVFLMDRKQLLKKDVEYMNNFGK